MSQNPYEPPLQAAAEKPTNEKSLPIRSAILNLTGIAFFAVFSMVLVMLAVLLLVAYLV